MCLEAPFFFSSFTHAWWDIVLNAFVKSTDTILVGLLCLERGRLLQKKHIFQHFYSKHLHTKLRITAVILLFIGKVFFVWFLEVGFDFFPAVFGRPLVGVWVWREMSRPLRSPPGSPKPSRLPRPQTLWQSRTLRWPHSDRWSCLRVKIWTC